MDSDKQAERAWVTMPECVREYVFGAVRKTVPAAPKNIRNYYSSGPFGVTTSVTTSKYQVGTCPVCGNNVYSTQHYCYQCGQCLEWEDLKGDKNEQ